MEQGATSFSLKPFGIYSAFSRHFTIYHQLFLLEAARDYPDHFNDAETDTNSKVNRGRKRGDRKHLGGTGRQGTNPKENESHIWLIADHHKP